MVKRLEITEAKRTLAEYVKELNGETIAVTDGDQVLAVLIATENSDWESVSMSLSPALAAIIEKSRRRHDREGGMSLEEVMAEFGITQEDLDAARDEAAEAESAPVDTSRGRTDA